jgi:hypothetical protein
LSFLLSYFYISFLLSSLYISFLLSLFLLSLHFFSLILFLHFFSLIFISLIFTFLFSYLYFSCLYISFLLSFTSFSLYIHLFFYFIKHFFTTHTNIFQQIWRVGGAYSDHNELITSTSAPLRRSIHLSSSSLMTWVTTLKVFAPHSSPIVCAEINECLWFANREGIVVYEKYTLSRIQTFQLHIDSVCDIKVITTRQQVWFIGSTGAVCMVYYAKSGAALRIVDAEHLHAGGPHTESSHTGVSHTGSPHTGSPHTGSPHTEGSHKSEYVISPHPQLHQSRGINLTRITDDVIASFSFDKAIGVWGTRGPTSLGKIIAAHSDSTTCALSYCYELYDETYDVVSENEFSHTHTTHSSSSSLLGPTVSSTRVVSTQIPPRVMAYLVTPIHSRNEESLHSPKQKVIWSGGRDRMIHIWLVSDCSSPSRLMAFSQVHGVNNRTSLEVSLCNEVDVKTEKTLPQTDGKRTTTKSGGSKIRNPFTLSKENTSMVSESNPVCVGGTESRGEVNTSHGFKPLTSSKKCVVCGKFIFTLFTQVCF